MSQPTDIIMERAIFQFEPDQLASLRRLAARRGVSVAALVREAVDAMLAAEDREARWARAMSLAGRFSYEGVHEEAHERGKDHDRWFVEAVEERIQRRPRTRR